MPRACLLLALLAVSCGGTRSTAPSPDVTPSPPVGLTQPYPYTTPTPPARPTAIDGIYARTLGPAEAGPRGPCRRCPPYRLEIADSTLTLATGVFFIENQVEEGKAIDWQSIGHYQVDGDTVVLFNDPNCPQTRGAYRWSLSGGILTLKVVEDECAFGGLRWRYLTAAPWAERS